MLAISRSSSPFVLFVLFHTVRAQRTCNTGVGAISVPVQNVTLIDGTIRWGAAISIGSPPQNIAFVPAPNQSNDTIIYSTRQYQCDGQTSKDCIANRGGEFNVSASSTWVPESDAAHAGTAPSDRAIPPIGDEFGQDDLHINSSVTLEQFPLAIVSVNDTGYNVLGLGTNSTVLTRLYQNGMIASRSWGLSWGLNGYEIDAQKQGSLVFGGYDNAKLTGTGNKIPMSQNPRCSLLVTATSMLMNFPNGTDFEILTVDGNPTTLTMCVEPEFPIITMPEDYWFNFMDVAGGSYIGRSIGLNNNYGELYFADGVYAGDLTIKLDGGSAPVSVRIPNNQLVQPNIFINDDGVLSYNISTREINIDSLQAENLHDLPLLGQTFLTSAYLFVEPDKDQFTIWQADPTSDQNIIPQAEEDSSPCTSTGASATMARQSSTPTSSGSSTFTTSNSLNAGAIAGGVIGGLAGLAIIAVIAFLLLRRKSKKEQSPHGIASDPTSPEKNGGYNLPGSQDPRPKDGANEIKYIGHGMQELSGHESLRSELGGEHARAELAGGDQEHNSVPRFEM